MRRIRHAIKVSWRIIFCLLLLTWIFNKIFVSEAMQRTAHWEELSRSQQWHTAWTIGPMELWRALSMISPVAFIISLGIVLLTIVLGVIRWRMVLGIQGVDLSFSRTLSISFVAQFFNSFLLGATGGDLIKAYYAARETHHKKTETVTTVFVDRLIGLWSMLMFAALMILPNWKLLGKDPVLSGAVVMILGMLVSLTIVLCLAFWGGLSKRFPSARPLLRKLPKGEMLERSLDSCRQFGCHKMFLLKTVGFSFLVNVLVVVQYIILSAGMNLQIPSLSLFLIVPLITCIASIPVTISGLGLRENLFVMMLATPFVDKTSILSLSLLAFAGAMFWSVAGGVVYMGLKKKEHLSEVTQDESSTGVPTP